MNPIMYSIKKMLLRLDHGAGPALPRHVALGIKVRLELVLNGNYPPHGGLCDLVYGGVSYRHNYEVYEIGKAWVKHQFKLWPRCSGNLTYPVPHATLPAQSAYHNEPRWEGEYGAARLDLAKHLLAAVNKQLRSAK